MGRKILLIVLCFFIFSNIQSQISWNATSNIAVSSFGNNHPRIVMDKLGNPLVVWNNSANVMFSRWLGSNFSTPVALNPGTITVAGSNWFGPDIASFGDTVYVVFKQTPESSSNSHIWCMNSFDGGITFSLPVQVENIGSNLSSFPTITTDDLGHPIIGFMKYNSSSGDAKWVVAKSIDYGSSYLPDTIASGWSSPTSEVCECCPGAITTSNNTVAMLYRDNDSNIRDSWAGISADNGITFTGGMNINQLNWLVTTCPSSGPDGFIMGDTLYSTFMSKASGMNSVYFNKSSISSLANSTGILMTGSISGLTQQNFPRIANSGSATAIVWKQIVGGLSELPILFTNDIKNGFPTLYNTVTSVNALNADVTLFNGTIFVVWQNNSSGTIQYRSGTYSITAIKEEISLHVIDIYPNPSSNNITINNAIEFDELKIIDISGKVIKSISSVNNSVDVSDLPNGIYLIKILGNKETLIQKFIKQ